MPGYSKMTINEISEHIGFEDHNSFYYNGIEFPWYAFDASCYAKANQDLLESFGFNKAALVKHFYQYVIQGRERRISSPYFRLTDYMKYGGEDLKQAFGSRRESYLLHWINYGYNEHRVGIGTIGVPEALSEYFHPQSEVGIRLPAGQTGKMRKSRYIIQEIR